MTQHAPAAEAPHDDVVVGSGRPGGVGAHVAAWWQRVRGGEMGAVPALAGVVVLTVLFTALSPFFLTERNFANLLTQAATLVMLAMALVFVLLLGEIDLSAGVTSGMTMALFVVLDNVFGVAWPLALLVAFGAGLATGFVIGFFVARIGIPSFVVTLGLFLGYQGLTLTIIGDGGLYRLQVPAMLAIQNSTMPLWAGWAMVVVIVAVAAGTSFLDRSRRSRAGVPNPTITLVWIKLAVIAVVAGAVVGLLSQDRSATPAAVVVGVPIVVPVVLAILWLGTFVLDRTRFGRYVYSVGGNAEAARRAGIDVRLVRWACFVVCSTLAVVSGLFSVSKVGSIDAAAGREIVLSGVAAAVVGGVSLFGGRGRLLHAAIGALVIAIITNGLGLLNLPAGVNYMVTGGVLVLAATVDALSRLRAGGTVLRA